MKYSAEGCTFASRWGKARGVSLYSYRLPDIINGKERIWYTPQIRIKHCVTMSHLLKSGPSIEYVDVGKTIQCKYTVVHSINFIRSLEDSLLRSRGYILFTL